ncbi:MAG TPA: hypothetical protein VL614_25180 [Acetobacteraceae bacterium]|jgi:hypothetical protein|nr:hypothetical protein [Acetobacteraceae bacterium]
MPNLSAFRMFVGVGNGAFFNALVPHATSKFGSLLGNAIKGASATTTGVGIFNEAEEWRQGRQPGMTATLHSAAMFFGFFAGANANGVGAWFWSQTFAMASLGNDLATKKVEPTLQNMSLGAKPTADLAIDALGGTSRLGNAVNLAYQAFGIYKTVVNTNPANLEAYYRKLDPNATILKFADSDWPLKLASMVGQTDDIQDIFLVKGGP